MLNTLEAVNRCLSAIGESRVNSINSGSPDAALAKEILEETTEDVLSVGWYDNTAEEVVLQPDALGKTIGIPTDWFHVEPVGRDAARKLSVKVEPKSGQRRLYDDDKKTYSFETSVTVRSIYNVPFDHLSYTLQAYIAAKAARIFQERTFSSQSLDGFTSRTEQEAWLKLVDAQIDVENPNVLRDSVYMATATYRNHPLRGR